MKDENVHNDMITAYFEEIEKRKNDPTSVFDGKCYITKLIFITTRKEFSYFQRKIKIIIFIFIFN